MIIKRDVLLKAIVTDKLKVQLKDMVGETMRELDEQQEGMERQYRRLMLEVQRLDARQAMAVREQVEAEKRKQVDMKRELERQLADYDELKMGEEVVLRVLEGTVDIQVGDNFFDRIRQAEIVVEDDIVKDIREP